MLEYELVKLRGDPLPPYPYNAIAPARPQQPGFGQFSDLYPRQGSTGYRTPAVSSFSTEKHPLPNNMRNMYHFGSLPPRSQPQDGPLQTRSAYSAMTVCRVHSMLPRDQLRTESTQAEATYQSPTQNHHDVEAEQHLRQEAARKKRKLDQRLKQETADLQGQINRMSRQIENKKREHVHKLKIEPTKKIKLKNELENITYDSGFGDVASPFSVQQQPLKQSEAPQKEQPRGEALENANFQNELAKQEAMKYKAIKAEPTQVEDTQTNKHQQDEQSQSETSRDKQVESMGGVDALCEHLMTLEPAERAVQLLDLPIPVILKLFGACESLKEAAS